MQNNLNTKLSSPKQYANQIPLIVSIVAIVLVCIIGLLLFGQIANLKGKVQTLEQRVTNTIPASVPSPSTLSIPSTSETPPKRLELLMEKDLEFCLGDQYTIQWNAVGFGEYDTVWIFALRPGGSSVNLDVRPIYANQNETGTPGEGIYPWKVGDTILGSTSGPETLQGGVYRIKIFDPEDETQTIQDISEPFIITNCVG